MIVVRAYNRLAVPVLKYCCQLWNPRKAKDIQPIEDMTSNGNALNHCSKALNLIYWESLHKLKLFSLQRLRELHIYKYIYLKVNTAYGAKYWWYNGTQNKNQKPSKTWNTVCNRVLNKQKPGTIASRKCSNWNVFVPRLYNSYKRYNSKTWEVLNKNSNFNSKNF